MKSMSARILASFFLIIGFNILLISFSLYMGYVSSRDEWNGMVRQEAQYTLEVLLDNIMEESGFLDDESCIKGLMDTRERLIGVAQIDIFNPQGKLLISWTNGSLDYYLARPAEMASAAAYYYENDLVGYYNLFPTEFQDFEFNRHFISQILLLFSGGIIISAALSLFLAFRMARHFTLEAKNTARTLINLSRGSRDIEIVPAVTTEISAINNAALTLQEKLIKEEKIRHNWYENLAHELRTPVTAMKSQFIACRDGILPLTDARWETILGELAGVESLIRDFAFLSRIEGADFKADRQAVTSRAVMDYLSGSLSPAARERNITLLWENQAFSFNCDFHLITSAFSQLIRNAVQHSPENSEIRISFDNEAGYGVFRVINSGHIDEESMGQLFTPLYKADNSRRANGSGLGLTIAYRITQILGARLQVENLSESRICFEIALLCCSSTESA